MGRYVFPAFEFKTQCFKLVNHYADTYLISIKDMSRQLQLIQQQNVPTESSKLQEMRNVWLKTKRKLGF
jgi:hypothetical protein